MSENTAVAEEIETITDFGLPVRVLRDSGGKWLNLNEMIAASCYDHYDASEDLGKKNTTVYKLTKSLPNIVKTKKIFPGYSRPVWVISLGQYAEVCHFLYQHNARFRHHSGFINNIFTRWLAGDQTLHYEVNANASSNNLLNQAAREEIQHQNLQQPIEPESQPETMDIDEGSRDPEHPLVKRTKTLKIVAKNHHDILDDRIAATKSIMDLITNLGGFDNAYCTEFTLHAKRLHNQYNGSVDNAQALILDGRKRPLTL